MQCDLIRPACTRCVRANKPCSGYRDTSAMMFHDESSHVIRKAKAKGHADERQSSPSARSDNTEELSRQHSVSFIQSRTSTPLLMSRSVQPSPESLAIGFFFSHFVAPGHLSYLKPLEATGLGRMKGIENIILACGLVTLANQLSLPQATSFARKHYVRALQSTKLALIDPGKLVEDETVMAVMLLSLYEVRTFE